jgi:hypothetical protein
MMRWPEEELDGGRPNKISYALLMGAQNTFRKEEYASSMGRRRNDVVSSGAQIKLRREECALSMGQRSNDATLKGAQIML